jgi:hypothetical protein
MKISNLFLLFSLISCTTGCFSPNVRVFSNNQIEAIGSRSKGDWRYHCVTVGTREHPFNEQTSLTVRIADGRALTAAELMASTILTAVTKSNGVFVIRGGAFTQCKLNSWRGADGLWHNPVMVSAAGRDVTFPISEKDLIGIFGPALVVKDEFSW